MNWSSLLPQGRVTAGVAPGSPFSFLLALAVVAVATFLLSHCCRTMQCTWQKKGMQEGLPTHSSQLPASAFTFLASVVDTVTRTCRKLRIISITIFTLKKHRVRDDDSVLVLPLVSCDAEFDSSCNDVSESDQSSFRLSFQEGEWVKFTLGQYIILMLI